MHLFEEEKTGSTKNTESGNIIKAPNPDSGQASESPAPKRKILRRKLIGRRGVPDEEYLEGVRRLAEALGGRRPRGVDFDSDLAVKVGAPSLAGLRRRFGSVERALELAGVAHLPPRLRPDVEARQKKLEKALRDLAGRPYVFRDELGRYGSTLVESLREELRRRGVAVLWRVKAPRLEEALEMYYGGAASRERMREGMGSRAYEMFSRYAVGRSFQNIAEEFGCTREWVRFSVAAGLARLFGLDSPGSDPAGRKSAHFVAKLGADGIPVVRARRRKLKISQERLADLVGIGRTTLYRVEKCRPVTEKVARKTADALGGSLEEFFHRTPPGSLEGQEVGEAKEAGRGFAVSLKGEWTDCGPQRPEGRVEAVADEWKNYPVKGHTWVIGRTDSGEWYFYRGPCCSPERLIPAGVPRGGELSVHAAEGEARAARDEALKALKTVGNRRLVPDVDRRAVAYSILRGTGHISLCLAVPRAGILELALLGTGPELRDGYLDHAYLRELAQRLGLEVGAVYSDLAAALAEAVEESGFPLPGTLEWEREGDGVRWLGNFAGSLGPGGASLGFGGPAAGVLTLEEAARLWRVPARRMARLLGSGEFPEGTYRRSAGTWLVEWRGLCEALGLPRQKKRQKEAAYLRLRWDGGELAYRGSENVIMEFAGRVVRTLLAATGAMGQGTEDGEGVKEQPQTGGEKEDNNGGILAKLKKAVRHSREFKKSNSVLVVLHLLGRGAAYKEIEEHLKNLGVPLRTRSCSNFLQNLKFNGLIRRNPSGQWELTEEGRSAAAALFEKAVGLADGLETKDI